MAALFGVHIGNSSIRVAICKDEDRVDVLANDSGDRITPAIIHWTPEGHSIGKTALAELLRNSTNIITRNKQLLNDGISEDELNHIKKEAIHRINKIDGNIKYEFVHNGKQVHVSIREVTGWIFKKIKSIAESSVGGSKELAIVITVPHYFSLKVIQLIRDVASKAGFRVLQVVDEASTAALGCGLGLDSEEPSYYCLVYRVGGATTDATILEVQDGMFSVVESVNRYNLGGDQLTRKLYDYLAAEFKRQYKMVDLTERDKHKLYAASESAKQILSIQNVAQCSCESVAGGYDFNVSVSRARCENIVGSLIPQLVAPIEEVIRKSKLELSQIKKVVTCGNTLRMPKLQETVRNLLPSAEIIMNSNPEEVIVVGAAKQAGYCSKFEQLPTSLAVDAPTLSSSFSIAVFPLGGEKKIFPIREFSPVPLRKRFKVTAVGESLSVSVLNKDNVRVENLFLGELETGTKFTLDVDINRDGKLVVTVTKDHTDETFHLKLDLNDDVSI